MTTTDQDSLRLAVLDGIAKSEDAYGVYDEDWLVAAADLWRSVDLDATDLRAEVLRVVATVGITSSRGEQAAARAMRAMLARHEREAAHEQV